MGEADWLRGLQVSVAWHQVVYFCLGAIRGAADEGAEGAIEAVYLGAEPQSHVCGDLVVAAAEEGRETVGVGVGLGACVRLCGGDDATRELKQGERLDEEQVHSLL